MSTENGKLVPSSNPTDMLQEVHDFLQWVQQSLQEPTDFDEILGIRDRGERFRQYSRQQRYGIEIQNTGAEIKRQAERRMGELLREMKEYGELKHGGDRRSASRSREVSLKLLGINRMQSSRWQRTASLPESIFEAYIRETKERQEEITTNGILAIVQSMFKTIIIALNILFLYNPYVVLSQEAVPVNEQISTLPPVSYCVSKALNSLITNRDEYKNWQKNIKWSHLLPEIQLRYGRTDIAVNRFFELEDGSTDNLDDAIEPRDEYQVLLIWELSEFAFSGKKAIAAEQQIRFDHLRINVIEKVTEYYFELEEAMKELKKESSKKLELEKKSELNRARLNALADNCIGEKTKYLYK
jgi:hypothetical protein